MNLWLRLIWHLLIGRSRLPLRLPADASRLGFRVLPNDLDTSGHMNNGRYLTFMDFGRLDIMVRSGLWRSVLRHRWTPIANAVMIRFRRELTLFQRFRLESRIIAWETTTVVMEQIFVHEGGKHDGEVAARALFKGGLYDRSARRFVPISRLMAEIGVDASSPPLTPEIDAFLHADGELRKAGADK